MRWCARPSLALYLTSAAQFAARIQFTAVHSKLAGSVQRYSIQIWPRFAPKAKSDTAVGARPTILTGRDLVGQMSVG